MRDRAGVGGGGVRGDLRETHTLRGIAQMGTPRTEAEAMVGKPAHSKYFANDLVCLLVSLERGTVLVLSSPH